MNQHTQTSYLKNRGDGSPFYRWLKDWVFERKHLFVTGVDRLVLLTDLTDRESLAWEDSLIVSIGRQESEREQGPLLNVKTVQYGDVGKQRSNLSLLERARLSFQASKQHGRDGLRTAMKYVAREVCDGHPPRWLVDELVATHSGFPQVTRLVIPKIEQRCKSCGSRKRRKGNLCAACAHLNDIILASMFR
jgi:hypothetical protein